MYLWEGRLLGRELVVVFRDGHDDSLLNRGLQPAVDASALGHRTRMLSELLVVS